MKFSTAACRAFEGDVESSGYVFVDWGFSSSPFVLGNTNLKRGPFKGVFADPAAFASEFICSCHVGTTEMSQIPRGPDRAHQAFEASEEICTILLLSYLGKRPDMEARFYFANRISGRNRLRTDAKKM
jgi:hypothetical protein